MLTLVLAVVLLVMVIGGAEFVRSTCRRQLMSTLVLPKSADAHATID